MITTTKNNYDFSFEIRGKITQLRSVGYFKKKISCD